MVCQAFVKNFFGDFWALLLFKSTQLMSVYLTLFLNHPVQSGTFLAHSVTLPTSLTMFCFHFKFPNTRICLWWWLKSTFALALSVFSCGLRYLISHCVGLSVGWSLYHLLFWCFWRFLRAVSASLLLPNHKWLLLSFIWHPSLPVPSILLPLPNTHDYAGSCIWPCSILNRWSRRKFLRIWCPVPSALWCSWTARNFFFDSPKHT